MQTNQVEALAKAALCDTRTARRWLLGENVRGLNEARLILAARKLGIAKSATPVAVAASATPELWALDQKWGG